MSRIIVVCAMPLLVLGCIQVPVDDVSPSFETVKVIRAGNFTPVALGAFTANAAQANFSKSINIRGSTMHPPNGGDFPSFLKQTFFSQLTAASRFDAASPVTISATMTKNYASEDFANGVSAIAATFTVTRGDKVVFSRNYEAENHWKSNFIGAIAIPEAFEEYNALYGQLVRKVLSDPEFVAALSR